MGVVIFSILIAVIVISTQKTAGKSEEDQGQLEVIELTSDEKKASGECQHIFHLIYNDTSSFFTVRRNVFHCFADDCCQELELSGTSSTDSFIQGFMGSYVPYNQFPSITVCLCQGWS